MSKSDAATAGEQQDQRISDLLADRARLREECGELLRSIGRHVKRAEAAEAECEALRAENARLREALGSAAKSLDSVRYMALICEDLLSIAGYATNRAEAARAALENQE